jgi:methyl-accepting chemotaxis protein
VSAPHHLRHLSASFLLLALAAAVALLAVAGISLAAVMAIAVLLVLAGGCRYVLGRSLQAALVAAAASARVAVTPAAPDRSELRDVGQRLLPVWQRQIETARTQTQAAVEQLVGRFTSIVQQLEEAAAAAALVGGSGEQQLTAVFRRSEKALLQVVESLETALDEKGQLLERMRGLEDFIDDLNKMAADFDVIAGQTNLLALYIATVAGRADEQGKGFAVVADEVRKLSNLSGATSRRIGDKVKLISVGIGEAVQQALASATHDDQAVERAEAAIHAVLQGFHAVSDRTANATEVLQSANHGLKHAVADAIVQLQFQDRTSQILSHVRDSLAMTAATVTAAPTEPLDVGELLAQLEQSYAMADERNAHTGDGTAGGVGDITFF